MTIITSMFPLVGRNYFRHMCSGIRVFRNVPGLFKKYILKQNIFLRISIAVNVLFILYSATSVLYNKTADKRMASDLCIVLLLFICLFFRDEPDFRFQSLV